jgi:hypothetical protein
MGYPWNVSSSVSNTKSLYLSKDNNLKPLKSWEFGFTIKRQTALTILKSSKLLPASNAAIITHQQDDNQTQKSSNHAQVLLQAPSSLRRCFCFRMKDSMIVQKNWAFLLSKSWKNKKIWHILYTASNALKIKFKDLLKINLRFITQNWIYY